MTGIDLVGPQFAVLVAAMAQAELAVEKREANWEAAIMQHGIPDDGVQFSVATQFLFQDGPKSGCR